GGPRSVCADALQPARVLLSRVPEAARLGTVAANGQPGDDLSVTAAPLVLSARTRTAAPKAAGGTAFESSRAVAPGRGAAPPGSRAAGRGSRACHPGVEVVAVGQHRHPGRLLCA